MIKETKDNHFHFKLLVSRDMIFVFNLASRNNYEILIIKLNDERTPRSSNNITMIVVYIYSSF